MSASIRVGTVGRRRKGALSPAKGKGLEGGRRDSLFLRRHRLKERRRDVRSDDTRDAAEDAKHAEHERREVRVRTDRVRRRGSPRPAREEPSSWISDCGLGERRRDSRADLGRETEQHGEREDGAERTGETPRAQREDAPREATARDRQWRRKIREVADHGRAAHGGKVEDGDDRVGRDGGGERRRVGREVERDGEVGERAREGRESLSTVATPSILRAFFPLQSRARRTMTSTTGFMRNRKSFKMKNGTRGPRGLFNGTRGLIK